MVKRVKHAVAWRWARIRRWRDEVVRRLWNSYGRPNQSRRPVQIVGGWLHRGARVLQDHEARADYTRFFRNVPQLEAVLAIALGTDLDALLAVAVLGCSSGAELYSLLWTIRTARPDLKILSVGVDFSERAIEKAALGTYELGERELEGVPEDAHAGLFAREGNTLRVQDWLRKGVHWKIADAGSVTLQDELGQQDIVLANNFLCHMRDTDAERCLRNVAGLVAPGGHLVVWGVNVDIRTRVTTEMGLTPVTTQLEEIYMADQPAREAWPLRYWGIEPLDKKRSDWTTRYATIFQRLEPARTPDVVSRRLAA
jgi:SAM-dependent methyltransferase